MEKELLNKMKYIAKKKKSISETIEYLDLSKDEILKLISLLNSSGEKIRILDNTITYDDKLYIKRTKINSDCKLQDLKVCLISDTHLATTFDRLDLLDYIYEKCERKGIKHIFHSGDIVEGYNIKENDTSYLKENSFEGQFEYVLEKYPTYNGKTYLINGNHDLRWLSREGKNVAQELALSRDDFVYLGDEKALVEINGIKIMVIHNKMHDYIENCQPAIIQQGHMHYSDIYVDDNIPHFQTSSLIDSIPYITKTKRVDRSCWFLTISTDDKGNVYYVTKELEKFDKEKKLIRVHN